MRSHWGVTEEVMRRHGESRDWEGNVRLYCFSTIRVSHVGGPHIRLAMLDDVTSGLTGNPLKTNLAFIDGRFPCFLVVVVLKEFQVGNLGFHRHENRVLSHSMKPQHFSDENVRQRFSVCWQHIVLHALPSIVLVPPCALWLVHQTPTDTDRRPPLSIITTAHLNPLLYHPLPPQFQYRCRPFQLCLLYLIHRHQLYR